MTKAEQLAWLRASMENIEARFESQNTCDVPTDAKHAATRTSVGRMRPRAKQKKIEDGELNESKPSAFARACKLVGVKDRCTHDLRKRLLEEEYSAQEVEQAIERMVSYGYVDDVRYAEALIDRRMIAGKGEYVIAAELKRIGIDPNDVPGWPERYFDDGAEVERAVALLRKKPPHSKNVRASAYRSLAQRGYRASVCGKAVSIWLEEL